MPTILGTLGLICFRIIIGIIITFIFSVIITIIIASFYNKINNHKMKAIKENNYFSRILHISYILLLVIIITSFISSKGSEYAYRNRLGFIVVTYQDYLYQKPGFIHHFFNPTAKIIINKSQLNKIKNYQLVSRNYKYEKQRQLIIKKAQYRLHYERDYYTSDY